VVYEHGIDHAADLDELLPVAAVARKARDLARGDSANLSERHVSDESAEAAAIDGARCRLAQVLVDDFDVAPPECVQALPHRVLLSPTLLIVHELLLGRLAHVQNRAAQQVSFADLVTHDDLHLPRRPLGRAASRFRRSARRVPCGTSPEDRSTLEAVGPVAAGTFERRVCVWASS
jgi:hypothetical protein